MMRAGLVWGAVVCAGMGCGAQTMPAPAPIPKVRAVQAPDSLTMQDPATFAEVKMTFPIAAGPYEPTWESIAKNYPGTPAWLREAKFGVWVHFGPQSAGNSGDWYARKIYQPGTTAYENHVRDFGHPSETGYKDVLHAWNPAKLDPAALVKLYKDAGARFLIVQGVHHDNFDNWNSTYQPWNSVNMGPRRDLIGEWAKAAKAAKMRYGVAFHHEYTWWWYQPAFESDVTGPKAGVAYDAAKLTLADGKGKWWEGYDPRLLYGINLLAYKDVANVKYRPEKGIFQDHLDYANWYATRWALRIEDVINKYDPDFIYTDGDSTGPFSGEKTGTGYKCDCMQRVMADFYNHALATRGKVDVFSIVKFHPPTNGIVSTVESKYPKDIKRDQDWIGENAAGDWFYKPDITYSARALELYLLEEVSRDGSYAVNIPIQPDGSIDAGARVMLKEMGEWMRVHGEGIYGSHAWVKFGEGTKLLPTGALNKPQAEFRFGAGDFRFTVGKDGAVYVWVLEGPKAGDVVKVVSMGTGALSVKSVAMPTASSSAKVGPGDDSKAWPLLMEKLVTVLTAYAQQQVEAGADVIQIFDSWAGALSVQDYRQYCLAPTIDLVQRVKAMGVPVIYFGVDTASLLPAMRETGADVIGLDWRIPLDEGRRILGPGVAVQGNLDPIALFAPEDVLESRVRHILTLNNNRPGHIFNLGHGIVPETPVDNVLNVVKWIKQYG